MAKKKTDPAASAAAGVTELGRRFGLIIKEGRERRNMSQTALANALGVSRQAVNMWESGTNLPSVRRWDQLNKLLSQPTGRPPHPLLELSEKRSARQYVPTYHTTPTGDEDTFLLDIPGVRYTSDPPGSGLDRHFLQCLVMANRTMSPWRYPLDAVYFSDRPSRVGEYVVVQFGGVPFDVSRVWRDPELKRAFENGEDIPIPALMDGSAPHAVKQLVAFDDQFVRLRQLSPERETTVERSSIATVFRVMDRDELYGPYLEIPSSRKSQ